LSPLGLGRDMHFVGQRNDPCQPPAAFQCTHSASHRAEQASKDLSVSTHHIPGTWKSTFARIRRVIISMAGSACINLVLLFQKAMTTPCVEHCKDTTQTVFEISRSLSSPFAFWQNRTLGQRPGWQCSATAGEPWLALQQAMYVHCARIKILI